MLQHIETGGSFCGDIPVEESMGVESLDAGMPRGYGLSGREQIEILAFPDCLCYSLMYSLPTLMLLSSSLVSSLMVLFSLSSCLENIMEEDGLGVISVPVFFNVLSIVLLYLYPELWEV